MHIVQFTHTGALITLCHVIDGDKTRLDYYIQVQRCLNNVLLGVAQKD